MTRQSHIIAQFQKPLAAMMVAGLCFVLSGCAPAALETAPDTPLDKLAEADPPTAAEIGRRNAGREAMPRKLFGFLRAPEATDPNTDAPAQSAAESGTSLIEAENGGSDRTADGGGTEDPLPVDDMSPDQDADIEVDEANREQPPGRFLRFLRKSDPSDAEKRSDSEAPVLATAPGQDSPAPDTDPTDPPGPKRGIRLFGGQRNIGSPNNPETIDPRGPVPPGEVIRVCEVKRRDMGKSVARSEGYRLIDSDPTSTEPRSQYITGFEDGCARQFTAALALFGSTQVHEATRYAPDNDTPYSDLDRAYERLKNRVCGVRRGQFCPNSRAAKLARETVFVTVYPRFGGPGDWLEILIHKGQLIKYQTRTR